MIVNVNTRYLVHVACSSEQKYSDVPYCFLSICLVVLWEGEIGPYHVTKHTYVFIMQPDVHARKATMEIRLWVANNNKKYSSCFYLSICRITRKRGSWSRRQIKLTIKSG